ncbi:MAG: 30S ribosomal protein S6 [Calditrichaeota bacterium]|nr:MAG: 30S ribosomal protein S6 [Calditrichota bacterium]
MLQLYETAVVFDSQAKSEDIEERINNVKNFITNHGGKIESSEELGKRRLAYEINKKQYGFYVFLRFIGPGQLISLLEREYRLSENVLRYLTLKIGKNQLAAEQLAVEDADNAKIEKDASPSDDAQTRKKDKAEPDTDEVVAETEEPEKTDSAAPEQETQTPETTEEEKPEDADATPEKTDESK